MLLEWDKPVESEAMIICLSYNYSSKQHIIKCGSLLASQQYNCTAGKHSKPEGIKRQLSALEIMISFYVDCWSLLNSCVQGVHCMVVCAGGGGSF